MENIYEFGVTENINIKYISLKEKNIKIIFCVTQISG